MKEERPRLMLRRMEDLLCVEMCEIDCRGLLSGEERSTELLTGQEPCGDDEICAARTDAGTDNVMLVRKEDWNTENCEEKSAELLTGQEPCGSGEIYAAGMNAGTQIESFESKDDWNAELVDGTAPDTKLQGSTVHSVQKRDRSHVSGISDGHSLRTKIKFWETLGKTENAKLARNLGPTPKIQQPDRK